LPVEERFIDSAQFADRIPVERYNIIKGIGQGASGTVLLCSDLVLEKLVAIKSLNQVEPEALVAFQKEARATCTLNHPNIVKVIDFGIAAGGAPYISVRHRRAYQTASQCKKTKGSETSGRPATWYGTGTSCSNSSLTREISIPDDAGWSRVN
jgi:serine/threonine protein kinase